jgi:pseudaminic acid cytidylyltransferase
VVSTDSSEIAEVAERFGAEVPFLRPAELADDHATTSAVLVHALTSLGSAHDVACCIYPAAPLIRAADLVAGYKLLTGEGAATVMPVTTFPAPVLRALKIGADGRLALAWPEHRATRSNDLCTAYHDAGQFYWVEAARFLATGEILGEDVRPLILPRRGVVDIDEPEDWALAELLYEREAPGGMGRTGRET